MVVGVCRLTLILSAGRSLKSKRSVLHRIKDRVGNKFNVSVAEVGSNDLWQRIDLGLAIAGNEGSHVNSQLDKVQNFILSLGLAEVVDSSIELIHFNDSFDGDSFPEDFEDEESLDAGDIPGDDE